MKRFDAIGKRYPIMVSGTITDASGRILSGQTIEAFIISISHAPILSIGLNCALGAAELRPYIETLHKECPFYVSAHPNAGLPNQFGGYDQSAEEFAALVTEFAGNGWLNIVGGCCGTTPEHIAVMAKAIKELKPREKPGSQFGTTPVKANYKTMKIIDNWMSEADKSISLEDFVKMISRIEDEKTLKQVHTRFNEQKNRYHPEQDMLMSANLFGRFQYIRTQGIKTEGF